VKNSEKTQKVTSTQYDAFEGVKTMDEIFCPSCGEEMEHWNQGIYECEECGTMIDSSIYEG
jgi:ribosomal protein L37AE/L43A